MHTTVFDTIVTHAGEPVSITFTITNQSGQAVNVDGATATFKIARQPGGTALLTKTQGSGITLSGNTAVITFSTSGLVDGGAQLIGDFFAQLKITKSGDSLIAAEGRIQVDAVIQ